MLYLFEGVANRVLYRGKVMSSMLGIHSCGVTAEDAVIEVVLFLTAAMSSIIMHCS